MTKTNNLWFMHDLTPKTEKNKIPKTSFSITYWSAGECKRFSYRRRSILSKKLAMLVLLIFDSFLKAWFVLCGAFRSIRSVLSVFSLACRFSLSLSSSITLFHLSFFSLAHYCSTNNRNLGVIYRSLEYRYAISPFLSVLDVISLVVVVVSPISLTWVYVRLCTPTLR